MSCGYAVLDAAYVLGSLAPAERADYEEHLRTCAECAQAVRELAGLPGLLARVPADVLDEPAVPHAVPDTLLPSLVAAAERQQRRRTFRTALLAAAAVAVVATGSAVVAASLGGDAKTPAASPPAAIETTAPPLRMTPVGDEMSTGWLSLTPVEGGTRLELTCEYRSAYGGDHAYTYKLVVYSKSGLVHQVESFEASPGEEVHVSEETSFEVAEIEKVLVENSYGAILLLSPDRTP